MNNEQKELIAHARGHLQNYVLWLEEAANMGGTQADEDRIAEVEKVIADLKELAK